VIIELNLSHLIFLLVAGISGVWAMMKIIATQNQRFFTQQFTSHEKAEFDFHASLARRLDGIEALHREDASQWQRLERELLTLKAELPLHYVRREDYVQMVAMLMTKLDAMALRHENLLLKGASHAGS
jgi:hypothetical protein